MPNPLERTSSLLAELKRRKVYRAMAIYVVVAIGALELADVLVPSTRLPDWTDEFVLILLILGLPLVLVLAWMFDVTPEGVSKTAEAEDDGVDIVTRSVPTADESAPAATELDIHAVAVLPFENLSGAREAEPFAAGLHDDLLTELSRVSALTVISRTSVKGYRSVDKTIPEIARELGVGAIIEGGVQQSGNRVRLNVQLIDARADVHLWAERYDRELTAESIFDLQSELAGEIMAALQAELTSEETSRVSRHPTEDLDAYRLFAIGREFFVDRSEAALHAAAEHFELAAERDPEYADAWAGMANALIMLVDYGHVDERSALVRAESAARRALELAPNLPEAYSALGNLYSARRQGAEALEAHRRAAELAPSYAGAQQWLCWVNLLLGRPQAALEAGRRAVRLAPYDPEGRGNLALALLGVGDLEGARAEAENVLGDHSDFAYALWVKGLALYQMDREGEARDAMLRISEGWAAAWPATARALDLASRGQEARAREIIARSAPPSFHAGLLHAALGERDAAFEAIRAAAPLHWDEALYLRYHHAPPLDALRGDARFDELIADLDRAWGVEEV